MKWRRAEEENPPLTPITMAHPAGRSLCLPMHDRNLWVANARKHFLKEKIININMVHAFVLKISSLEFSCLLHPQ
jgi:hypothetical protein